MSDVNEGREQITNREEFKQMLRMGARPYRNFDCWIPIQENDLRSSTLGGRKDFLFLDAIFHEKVMVESSQMKLSDLSFQNIIFKKEVAFDGKVMGRGSYMELDDLSFQNIIFEKEVTLSGINCKNTLKLDSVQAKNSLEISNSIIGTTEIVSCEIQKLEIAANKFLKKFKVSQNDLQQFGPQKEGRPIEKIKIKELAFIGNTIEENALIRFGYLDVDQFTLRNIHNPMNSEINIGECVCKEFTLQSLRNLGKFRMYNINVGRDRQQDSTLIISDSSFGDSEFQNVNLRCYMQAFIKDNLFPGLKYTGLKWPDAFETDPPDSEEKKQDTYRSLKNVAQENHDAPQAIEHYAREMETYSRVLSKQKGRHIDKAILAVNRWTNNFGLNWVLPIGWILVCGSIFYALLLYSLSLSPTNPDCWDQFFVFLNPAHRARFIGVPVDWGFWSYTIDFLFRIIETTLIYQTIIAFRKYSRKI